LQVNVREAARLGARGGGEAVREPSGFAIFPGEDVEAMEVLPVPTMK
jgi:hypothetical protein